MLTGIPTGIIPGFTNFTGTVLADMLRLSTSIAPPGGQAEHFGLPWRRYRGLPNGPPVTDDVVAIELRRWRA